MTVESATYIDTLDDTYPADSDDPTEGAEHIRQVKTVLQSSFPAVDAAVSSSSAELDILTGVTSTAAELNILDGVTSTAAELNVLDGITSTVAELNILDGVTSTAAELNILDGVTSTAGEINTLDGFTGDKDDLNYAEALKATGVTSTEYDYLDGVTSNIQTQLNAVGSPGTASVGDDEINSTFTTTYAAAVAIGTGSHKIPKGVWMVAASSGQLSLRIQTGSSTWVGELAPFCCAVISNGSNVEVFNTAGTVSYYRYKLSDGV